MQLRPTSPLTGGMMVIIMPGRKGDWVKTQEDVRKYDQQTTQQIVNLSDDVINHWAHKPLKDETTPKRQHDGQFKDAIAFKHDYTKRLEYWLNDHFLSIVGGHSLNHLSCSWTFQHNKA